jgi:hypothetical protein
MTIRIVNPLGAALAHYSSELQSVLDAAGAESEITSQLEPGLSGRSRLHWVVAHFVNVRRAASKCRGKDLIISTWPVLGYFDLALNRLLGGNRTWLVVHDPSPLVRSVGLGHFGHFVLRCARRHRIICHSTKAVQTIADKGGHKEVVRLPHPISATQGGRKFTTVKRILVIGQFKPDRDLELLRHVGNHLHEEANLRIAGRGWPNLRYWDVKDGFLSEAEFSAEIESASVVLIPYRRFFQSGVAVRCIEIGIPFIGPKGSSLDELVSVDSVMLQDIDDRDAWVRAIQDILRTGATGVPGMTDRYLDICHAHWFKWLASAVKEDHAYVEM